MKTACTGKTEGEENRRGSGDAQAQRALPGSHPGITHVPRIPGCRCSRAGVSAPALLVEARGPCAALYCTCQIVQRSISAVLVQTVLAVQAAVTNHHRLGGL